MAATGRFLSGLPLGVAVVPLALAPVLLSHRWGYDVAVVLGGLLFAGAVALVRRDRTRVAGVVTGAVVATAAYVAFYVWLMANLFQ